MPEKFIYIDLESVNNGLLTSRKIINKSEAPSRAQRTIIKNDILYQTVRPYQMNNLFINSLDSTYPYIASTGYALLRTEENPYFVYSILHQKSFVNKVLDKCTGTSYPAISANDLGAIIVGLPSIKEQEKISRTFELLDKKIELQSKKIEDLKLFKSSQIINFFNKNNFAEVNIKNIGFFQSGNSLSKDCLTSSGVPIILYGDLYTKYNEVIKKVEQYTNDNKKYVKSKQNQIIFPTSTTVNSLSLISPSSINLDGIIYGGDILILNLNKDVNADFLSYEINHYKKKEFSKIAQGSTIIHIHAEDLLNCKIALPNIVLQDKFALTFNKLNQKIELENNKLNKLQKLKKGLMQSMFV